MALVGSTTLTVMSSPKSARNPALVAVDVVVGVVVLVVALVLGLLIVATLTSYGALADGCGSGGCDTSGLSAIQLVASAIVVFAYALGLGMFIVRLVQRRWGWYFPVIGAVVMLVAFYAATAAVAAWARGMGIDV